MKVSHSNKPLWIYCLFISVFIQTSVICHDVDQVGKLKDVKANYDSTKRDRNEGEGLGLRSNGDMFTLPANQDSSCTDCMKNLKQVPNDVPKSKGSKVSLLQNQAKTSATNQIQGSLSRRRHPSKSRNSIQRKISTASPQQFQSNTRFHMKKPHEQIHLKNVQPLVSSSSKSASLEYDMKVFPGDSMLVVSQKSSKVNILLDSEVSHRNNKRSRESIVPTLVSDVSSNNLSLIGVSFSSKEKSPSVKTYSASPHPEHTVKNLNEKQRSNTLQQVHHLRHQGKFQRDGFLIQSSVDHISDSRPIEIIAGKHSKVVESTDRKEPKGTQTGSPNQFVGLVYLDDKTITKSGRKKRIKTEKSKKTTQDQNRQKNHKIGLMKPSKIEFHNQAEERSAESNRDQSSEQMSLTLSGIQNSSEKEWHQPANGKERPEDVKASKKVQHFAYTWTHGGYQSQEPINRPAAVDRLEGRMLLNIVSVSHQLLESMNHVLSVFDSGLEQIDFENVHVFNTTRYDIMLGVRQQLVEIAEANDMVHYAFMKITRLTRDIIRRAHHERLTGRTTQSVVLNSDMIKVLDRRKDMESARREERFANDAITIVQDLKSKQQKIQEQIQKIHSNFQQNFARTNLQSIVSYVNLTYQQLSRQFLYSTKLRYTKRNSAILVASLDNLTIARNLLLKADNLVASGAVDYRGNYAVVQDWVRQRGDDGVGAPVSLRRSHSSATELSPYDDRHHSSATELSHYDRSKLQTIISRLKKHAQEQERIAEESERLLRPAIQSAARLSRNEDAALVARLSAVASRLITEGKKLFSLLDSIRVLTGSQNELRWTAPQTSKSCQEKTPEGSGDEEEEEEECIQEGSGDEMGEGDDEDFVFVDEKFPSKHQSLAKFGQDLSVYLNGVILRSNDLVQQADVGFFKTEELLARWKKIAEIRDAEEKAKQSWKNVIHSLQNVTNYADRISSLAQNLSRKVTSSHDSIVDRMNAAVQIAEKKLAEVQARKSRSVIGEPQTKTVAEDAASVIEAVEKVNEVQKTQAAVLEHITALPQACVKANSQLQQLHTKISHLRQQVNRARALLDSIQLSVSLNGSGFLSIPITGQEMDPSLTTTIDVCIKTQAVDGPVLFLKGNKTTAYSLVLNKKKLSVTVFEDDGDKLDTLNSDSVLLEEKWYRVRVNRTGQRVSMQVMSEDGSDSVSSDIIIPSLAYNQSPPMHMYIGAVPRSEPFSVSVSVWKGCLGNLQINRQALSLLQPSSKGEGPQLCSTHCATIRDTHSLVFEGNGFLHFPASVLPLRMPMQSVSFHFRTRQGSVALLHLVNQRQRFLLRVMLSNGAILLDTTTPMEAVILRSQENNYNDGKFHWLKIQYRDSTTYPEIDGVDGAFVIERGRPHSLSGMADGVVMGAFVNSKHQFETSVYRPLLGCIQNLEIGGKLLSVAEAEVRTGVFLGNCNGPSIWSNCIQFGVDSEGIDLGQIDKSGTVAILFSATARGPLLSFSREANFDLTVSVLEDSLEVSTEDTTYNFPRPNEATKTFSLLTITDDGKEVAYNVWGITKSKTYKSFWSGRSDVNSAHSISVGMIPEDPGKKLIGMVAQLIVGNRFIDLSSYAHSNKLTTCQRPLPDLATIKTFETSASPVCSLDINC